MVDQTKVLYFPKGSVMSSWMGLSLSVLLTAIWHIGIVIL